MARLARKFRVREAEFSLQLTSMVDMFTIILVFLLKSFTTSAVQVAPVDNLVLPQSTAVIEPGEALKVVVTTKGIYVDEERVIEFQDGKIDPAVFDKKDPKFIRPLYTELDKHAKKAEEIQSQNPEMKFTGQYILQADQNLDYAMVKKVIYTSMLAGYADLRLGTMGME